ncbi:RagB/SusD family nutrient uptake outer membrane protein [uncultured Bacteroides sp.]|uniref:RagB/SusD family nutrient uptake outer membrane protein n=1 Tax=uncultured Bacteroides sp. TaxID=162156 RepID=UPI002AA652E2|nr:RagB/SusD family nutrient uptake outer membrane protein [uncultured Bacteroides sp.]
MKQYILNSLIGITLLLFASCSDILDEQPRSILTPDLFKTTSGLQAGLTAAYDGLRYISGTEPTMCSTVLGTDEFTSAASGGSKELDMTPGNGGSGINAATGSINVFWVYPFSFINTCNGIIEFGNEAGLSKELIAEAYFLRGYYYFNMVQMFGGVPLDMGSGDLKFNTTPTTLSKRNTQEEVYAAIIDDMKYAAENLPISPRLPGCAFRATAIHYLAKVYLTHGDNQLALTEAEKLLSPSDPYTANSYGVALQPTYAEVIKPTNERNSEILFTCEHSEAYNFNETAAGYGSGPVNKDDRSLSYFVPNYQSFTLGNGTSGFLVRTIEYSRPWIRFAPTFGLLNNIFADKINDSRFNASFQTVWLNNGTASPNGLLNKPINPGDTAFVMLSHEVSDAYRATKNYRIWTPSQMDRSVYPALKKFFDPNRQDPNDASGRPFLLAKLSETYLIAAEAALNLGNASKARDYILVLRKRAATPGNEATMAEKTPGVDGINIDYILDERARELCGEQMRWFDLKRTGKWRDRATTYSLNGTDMITRDIKSNYDLRPIPQDQIDLMGNSQAEKSEYQNPGY